MRTMLQSAVIAMILAAINSQTCTRLRFYGSPANLIIQAHEHIDKLLQGNNQNTRLQFEASQRIYDATLGTFYDLVYTIRDARVTPSPVMYWLAIRIGEKKFKNTAGKTFTRVSLEDWFYFDNASKTNFDNIIKLGWLNTKLFDIYSSANNIPADCLFGKLEYSDFTERFRTRTAKQMP